MREAALEHAGAILRTLGRSADGADRETGELMSVLVIVKVAANRAAFEKVIAERGDQFKVISERGRAAGALHHRFGVGDDGTVVVVDEWESAGAFQAFFDDPEIMKIMQDSGAQGPPEVVIVDALDTVDMF
jgi:hypothetical protein